MEEKNKNNVWAIVGISKETKLKARMLAKNEGKHIGKWIEDNINNWGSSQKRDACFDEDKISQKFEFLSRKVDELAKLVQKPKPRWFGN